ncbi:protein of unknown function [Rubritalea squalenifaciens DSM 18772]|uniref:DUF4349 domain-containing protein n=2 Tax=Rubritalea squalenifaciens TaxID=407226 RepID=A0A1M6LQT5_9BACT|nr:protein of unknown function [Rubritalea squalenifaciens DSM 18772]
MDGLSGAAAYSPAPAPVASMEYANSRSRDAAPVSRKLIETGRLSLETPHVSEVAKNAEGIVKKHGGYVENKNEDEDEVGLSVRVPAGKLKTSMEELETLGKVSYSKIRTKDVTDQYIDMEAKIRNLRVLRERLRKVYEKATKVEEMLEIEKELARVQTELDSIEGRMRAMQKNIAYSELDISIERKSVPGPLGAVAKGTGWVFKKLWVLN